MSGGEGTPESAHNHAIGESTLGGEGVDGKECGLSLLRGIVVISLAGNGYYDNVIYYNVLTDLCI